MQEIILDDAQPSLNLFNESEQTLNRLETSFVEPLDDLEPEMNQLDFLDMEEEGLSILGDRTELQANERFEAWKAKNTGRS